MKRILPSAGYCVVSLFLILQGCAATFHSRNCALVSQQDSTKVSIVSSGGGYSWSEPVITMRGKVAQVTLNNFNEYYLIQQSKNGYLPNTLMIRREKFNSMKIIDFVIPVIADCYLISGVGVTTTNDPNNPGSTITSASPSQYVAWYFGTAGWIDLGFGSWKTYSKTYTLPELTPIPYKTLQENKLFVKEVGFDIKKDSLIRTYYSTYKKYLNNELLYSSGEKEAYKYRHTEFEDTLNTVLKKWKYIDTSKGMFSNMYDNSYYIKCSIYGMSINTINTVTFFTLKCKWQLYSPTTERPVYEAITESSSKWGTFDESDNSFATFIGDAMDKSLVNFMEMGEVQKNLNDKLATANTMDKWNTIDLTGVDYAASLADGIKSVVTIKTPEGHGSGCIVSSDGYVVTNYHVIAEDTSKTVQVIFSDGDTLTADYVRSNSGYDLALFKINKKSVYMCFTPSLSKDIAIGSEVYAIGTPEDISLGQTITKGIISGKRKVQDKTIIQTDVSINSGNSGGGLVTKDGVLEGIVNAKLMGEGIQGIGFAIPAYYIEDALKVKFTSHKQ